MHNKQEEQQSLLVPSDAAVDYAAVNTHPAVSKEISVLFQYLNQAAVLQENASGLAEKFQTAYRLGVHRFFQAALPPLLIAFLQTNFPTLLAFIPDISVELVATSAALGAVNVAVGVADHHYESKASKVMDDFIKEQNKLKQLLRAHSEAMHKLLELNQPLMNGVTALQALGTGQSIISQKTFDQLSQHKHPWLKRTRQVMDGIFNGLNGIVAAMFVMLFVNGYLEKNPPATGYDTKAWFQALAGGFAALLAATGALASVSDAFVEKHRHDAAFSVIDAENKYIQERVAENRSLVARVKRKFDIAHELSGDESDSSFFSNIIETMRDDAKVISHALRRGFFDGQEGAAGSFTGPSQV